MCSRKVCKICVEGCVFFMCNFVFAVSPSGVCSLVSRRSGRRLSGSAFSACVRAVSRSVLWSGRFPLSRLASLLRRLRARREWRRNDPACFAAAFPAAVASASAAGSRLFLFSPAFVAALSHGCPLRFLLSVFRWPVRSAVVLALCRVFLSSPVALSLVPRPVRVAFLRASLFAFGFSVSGRCDPSRAVAWLSRSALSPSLVPVFSGVASVAGLSAGLAALARCLFWLSCRSPLGRGCPPAVAPSLALLARLVAASLS